MAKCITNNSSTNHHRTQHQMINDSSGGGRKVCFKNNDFTCKSTDDVETLGRIDVFMLMTASIYDTFLLFPPSLPADG